MIELTKEEIAKNISENLDSLLKWTEEGMKYRNSVGNAEYFDEVLMPKFTQYQNELMKIIQKYNKEFSDTATGKVETKEADEDAEVEKTIDKVKLDNEEED